ncbi:MAG TPA: acetylglutamate kinase [Promineifilum sp.]|nr:acetylglutamate kinase [Promineifilum sp.]HRO90786.1 acetylglutamate kinase [Promineifilum sp.]HRQ12163.1 acetylglutamate kinase [Promineifilum sp.]
MTRVIKIGGNEMNTPGFLEELARQIGGLAAATGEPLVVVHGGGQEIATLQTRLGIEPVKVDGLRVTDAESLAVAQMVLSGHTNKAIVKAFLAAGLDAAGFSGIDGGLLRCRKKQHPTIDLGLVGEITGVRARFLNHFAMQGIIPVISPISLGEDGQTYNVNADEAAGAIAAALGAEHLDFVSNVPGVMEDGRLLSQLTAPQANALIDDGIINGGMIPKVRTALEALERGVPRVRIVNLAGLKGGGGTVFLSEPASASLTPRPDRWATIPLVTPGC